MGVVYRGTHRDTGAVAAVKTIRGADRELAGSIRREIRALMPLRHPGIAALIDEGESHGAPWYAMELIDGASLAARGLPVAVAEATALIGHVCSALAYLHGEGVIHRDIKPDNIVVRADGRPVLIDFGIASRFAAADGREVLEVEDVGAGTAAFMAPEQASGRAVDARADIYALGCVLYWLLAGRPPFAGPTAEALLRQHATARPAPIDGVPPEIDTILDRMLAKDPQRRFGYAADVARSLGADPEVARPYLYRPRMVGRERTSARLARVLGGLHDASAVVLVGGESGAGKTRLVTEVMRQLGARGTALIAASCRRGGGPLHGLRPVLLAARTEATADQRSILAPYEPTFTATRPAPPLPEAAARTRVFRAVASLLAKLARERPVVLAIDDLQWADDLTSGFVEHASARGALSGPVGVVATYRTDETGPALDRLLDRDDVDAVTVERLAPRSIAQIAASMLALPEAPPDLCAFVADRSAGNAFFACELLRAAVDGGKLARDGQGRWTVTDGDYASLDLPRGVRDVVANRLAGLDARALDVARAAAVLGYDVSIDVLAAMAGDRALDRLAELERRAVVELGHRGRVRFDHHTIRDAVVDAIDPADRGRLHAEAARAIESSGDVEAHLAELGRHHEAAGALDAARTWYGRAAVGARARYANADAIAAYKNVVRLAPDDATAHNDLGELLQLAGDYDAALAAHARAYTEATARGDKTQIARALREQGWIHQQRAHPGDAAPLLASALAAARDANDRPGTALCLGYLAALHGKQSRLERARELFMEALDIELELGHPRACTTRVRLANTTNELGLLDEAERLFEQALDGARAIGDRASEAMAVGNYAILHYDRGQIERAAELFEAALAIAREIGERRRETMTLGNLAAAYHDLGRLFDAARAFELGLAGARELGLRRSEAIMLGNYARLEGETGDIDSALIRFEASIELLRDIAYPAFEAMTTVYRAALLRRLGRLDDAARDLDRVDALRSDFAADYHVDITLACERGHHALARGDDPRPYLDAAAGGSGGLQRLVDRLRAAIAAGPEDLVWGERVEDVPAGLSRALARRGKPPPVDRGNDTA